jgi:hypothetical protein
MARAHQNQTRVFRSQTIVWRVHAIASTRFWRGRRDAR